MSNIGKIEYRIKKVERFFVTRYEEDVSGTTAGSREIGSAYANAEMAHQVAYALARQEHEQLGWDLGDKRIRYPYREDDLMTSTEGASIS